MVLLPFTSPRGRKVLERKRALQVPGWREDWRSTQRGFAELGKKRGRLELATAVAVEHASNPDPDSARCLQARICVYRSLFCSRFVLYVGGGRPLYRYLLRFPDFLNRFF